MPSFRPTLFPQRTCATNAENAFRRAPEGLFRPTAGSTHGSCAAYYMGANRSKNPFMPPDAFAGEPDRLAVISGEAKLSPERAREIIDDIHFYPPIKHAYCASICGPGVRYRMLCPS